LGLLTIWTVNTLRCTLFTRLHTLRHICPRSHLRVVWTLPLNGLLWDQLLLYVTHVGHMQWTLHTHTHIYLYTHTHLPFVVLVVDMDCSCCTFTFDLHLFTFWDGCTFILVEPLYIHLHIAGDGLDYIHYTTFHTTYTHTHCHTFGTTWIYPLDIYGLPAFVAIPSLHLPSVRIGFGWISFTDGSVATHTLQILV